MAAVFDYYQVGSYNDFKIAVEMLNCDQFCFVYSDSSPNFSVGCISSITGMAVWYAGGVSIPSSFSTDFPNAVTLTTNGTEFLGPVIVARSYDDWKTIISTLNLGGIIFYIPPPNLSSIFGVINCSLDFGFAVSFEQTGSIPATFTTDFPNAIQLADTSTFPLKFQHF